MLSLIIMNYLINGKCLFFCVAKFVFAYIQSQGQYHAILL